MAASPTPRPSPADLLGPLGRALDRAPAAVQIALGGARPTFPLAIALSGGADSSALLLGAVCAFGPGAVHAIHVHHGLQAAADGFERHCATLCEQLGVPFQSVRVQARHQPGESPEDAARRARYAALAAAARGVGAATVWLGHHADDQAETLLLALSRGAGLPGLASMAARFDREGQAFERPFLAVPGSQLRQWLRGEGVAWVEDPTNDDTGLTRNRIRHVLLPALEAAFPSFRETFARSARHAARGQALLSEVAAADLAAMGGSPQLQALQAHSRGRQANLLRHWLRVAHGAAPSEAQLEEVLDQVDACRTRGHRIRLKVASGFVERAGDALVFQPGVTPGGM